MNNANCDNCEQRPVPTMKALWDAILKDALPTKWSKLIAGAIPGLLGAAWFLPEFLNKIGANITQGQKQQLLPIVLLSAISLWLSVLLVSVVLQHRSLRLTSAQFTEYKGAFFKRKPDGGYHEAVYCGICKSPTATGSYHIASYYKCKCGWVSSFNKGDFPYIFKQIPP
ncbi:MAG: hypothetical protein A2167_05160 [Planctomycetes bacterium RBG_13_46_10]|nr:MAG: hypothetical protein A2167_05160 [Planctomycetes bacterium RBG_13_46_10]